MRDVLEDNFVILLLRWVTREIYTYIASGCDINIIISLIFNDICMPKNSHNPKK